LLESEYGKLIAQHGEADTQQMSNPTKTVGRLDDDKKGLTTMDTPRGRQSMWTVNEYGLYSLDFGSRKTEALLQSVQLIALQEHELNVVKLS